MSRHNQPQGEYVEANASPEWRCTCGLTLPRWSAKTADGYLLCVGCKSLWNEDGTLAGSTPDPVSDAIEKEMRGYMRHSGGSPMNRLWNPKDVRQALRRIAAISYARGVEDSAKLVVGWRERDWPEGFDRHTAQIIADDFKNRLTPHKDTV